MLEPEEATSVAGDVTWSRAPLEVTATVFRSHIRRALMYEQLESGPFAGRMVNAEEPTRTTGTEFIARFHEDDLDVILTHMFIWSTESNVDEGGVREVPLNPRHTASIDVLWELGRRRWDSRRFTLGGRRLRIIPIARRAMITCNGASCSNTESVGRCST